ncbi:hypothetical protein L21SP5_00325 [Salinivirga cyanobacteriivorans]|uniref:Lipoprotein n=1 Tax=Salinivirga cyanobacteriivorans TaxID=1307839 RepID=A0A0S2HVI6_9BACT|nr:hypothetical protein [Salinivirga cyanobacteriivorans]ALO14004.1 hypothetical protein L21SP5_00325 [Salinivirga cyanobacteriivorans]
MKLMKYVFITGLIFMLAGCGSPVRYQKSPVDKLVKQLSNERDFSIILYDMNYNESSNDYNHQYQVLIPKEDTVLAEITPWYTVSDMFFQKHVDNMGMEIVSKIDGKLNKKAAPPGYNHYVGNERYGRWENRNGNSFWEFYGKYAFMSSMFNMMSHPVQRSYYNDYRNNYYGSRSYYGPTRNGRNYYGTKSRYNQNRQSTAWNRKGSTFKSKVRSRVKQSASRSRSAFNSRRSRGSSRYSSSSYRSRGGGFGK